MLRFFGAQQVWVLNGGLKKWLAEERDVVGGPVKEFQEQPDVDYGFEPVNEANVILQIG